MLLTGNNTLVSRPFMLSSYTPPLQSLVVAVATAAANTAQLVVLVAMTAASSVFQTFLRG